MADLPGEQQRSTHGPRGYPPGPLAGMPSRRGQARTRRWPWIVAGLTLVFILLFGGCFALVTEFVNELEERSGPEITVTYQMESAGTTLPIVYPVRDLGMVREPIAAGPGREDIALDGFARIASPTAGNDIGGGR